MLPWPVVTPVIPHCLPPRQVLSFGHQPLDPTRYGTSLTLAPPHLQVEERHGATPGAEKGHALSQCLEAWLIGGGSFLTYPPTTAFSPRPMSR